MAASTSAHRHSNRRWGVAGLSATALVAVGAATAFAGVGPQRAGITTGTPATALAPAATADPTPAQVAVAKRGLPAGDGWGSSGTGTTGGGSAATPVVVTTRAELVAALGTAKNTAPKLILVSGVIDANTDDNGKHLTCEDYAAGTGYSREAYLRAYDPATWGRTTVPSGTLEDARAAAAKAQAAKVQLKVRANTTIMGLGADSGITGGNLVIKRVDNVIVRNLRLSAAEDCFPQWDPTDGKAGNWNSNYDLITLSGATHVWIDHNGFTDQPRPDSSLPDYFGRQYEVHDGLLDIIRISDFVTVSYNSFADHDKTTLIGNSDSQGPTDTGHLRVTLHHNVYSNIVQRAPRVRFGQVDVYNNIFSVPATGMVYQIGVGKGAQIVAQSNLFQVSEADQISKLVDTPSAEYGSLHASSNYVQAPGDAKARPTNLIAAYNAANPDKTLSNSVVWRPELRTHVDAARSLPDMLAGQSGPGHL